AADKPNHRHQLLRIRGEWPRQRGPAEQSEKFAPLHISEPDPQHGIVLGRPSLRKGPACCFRHIWRQRSAWGSQLSSGAFEPSSALPLKADLGGSSARRPLGANCGNLVALRSPPTHPAIQLGPSVPRTAYPSRSTSKLPR